MTRTAVRQSPQVQPSEVYDDTIAPSQANYETNTTDAENDFNALRSQVHNLLENMAGNWWDDLNIPSTLDTGTQRGVNDLNTDLHALERKRIARHRAVVGANITVPAAVAATGNLAVNSIPLNNETVTIGTKTYTFQTVLTNVDGNVLIGASASASIDNLVAAINLGAGAGTLYALATTLHPTVSAAAGAGDTMDATAKTPGTAGNTIATTETFSDVLSVWGGATLSGGVGDMVILTAAGHLPGNTTAAIGAVTTRGTVSAYNATFGTATLAEVTGASGIQPKNLCLIVDTASGDPILDAQGREVYALFQTESNTDASTITTSTPNRAQLSFVVRNVTFDDLILASGSATGGKSIDYAPVERYALEDIPEESWIGDDFVDVGAANVTRQAAYDNQGTTPVDQTTNAILDLEAAGIAWRLRDDLQNNLFSVIEGSAGGTSEIEFGADVDNFDNDAVNNDFANALKVSTTGTEIDIGVTPGHIETTGANDLHLQAAREIFFDDTNQTGSTWAQTDGIKLSDTTAEWDDYETYFGEVSLLNAIVQAAQMGVTRCKAVAQVSVGNITANTLIEGPSGPGAANISADLCDYRTVTFVDDVDIFINGLLQRNGANAAANHDVYPSAVAAEQQYGCFYAEFDLKYRGGTNPDVITMLVWG